MPALSDDELFKIFFAIHYMTTGMFLWELLVSINFDYEYYRGRKRWTPAFFIYSMSRIAAILNLILDQIAFHYSKPDLNCRSLGAWIGIAGSIAITASTLIFVARACATWSWKKSISIPLLSLTLCTFAACLSNIRWLHCEHILDVGCAITKVDHGFSISNAIAISVDLITLITLILGICTQQDGTLRRNGTLYILLCDGLLYVGVLLLFNIGSIIMSSTSHRPMSQLMLATPIAFLSVILSGRCHRSMIMGGVHAIIPSAYDYKTKHLNLSSCSPMLSSEHLTVTAEHTKVLS